MQQSAKNAIFILLAIIARQAGGQAGGRAVPSARAEQSRRRRKPAPDAGGKFQGNTAQIRVQAVWHIRYKDTPRAAPASAACHICCENGRIERIGGQRRKRNANRSRMKLLVYICQRIALSENCQIFLIIKLGL